LFHEFLKRLNVLLVDDLRQSAQRVRTNDIILRLQDVVRQTIDDHEDFSLADFELFDEDVDEAAQVGVLGGWHLEQLRHVEEHIRLFNLCELFALVQQESDLVEDVLALRLFELLFVENLALLRKLALRQVRVGIGVL